MANGGCCKKKQKPKALKFRRKEERDKFCGVLQCHKYFLKRVVQCDQIGRFDKVVSNKFSF